MDDQSLDYSDVPAVAPQVASLMTGQSFKISVLGATTSSHTLTRASIFQEMGHDVFIVTPTEKKEIADIEVIGCPRGTKSGIGGKIDWLKRVFSAVKSAKADIYHAHYAAELTTWAAALLGKKPLVITVMGGDVLFDEQGSLGPVGRFLTKFALKKADLVTVKSSLLADVVKGFGVSSEKVVEVVWGVDHRAFKNDQKAAAKRREKWGVPADKKILFSPRMLTPFYNQDLMIEAFAKIHPNNPETHLVFSTYNEDVAYKEKLTQQAKSLGVLDHLTFVPAEESYEMAASYAAADLILSLPPSDGTPQSVMEAMACETPVLMTDLARYREFFDHKETTWFTPLKVEDVTSSIQALLDDPELCASICEKAAAKVKEIADLETQASLVNEHYKRLKNK